MSTNTEVAVIGGGPAGYVAALRASQLGARVVLVEKDTLGGTCLNRGCIPTKSLLQSTGVLEIVKDAKVFGVSVGNVSFDLAGAVDRKNRVVSQLVEGIKSLLRSSNVQVVHGDASLTGNGEVSVTKSDGQRQSLTANKIIIATGSVPAMPPIRGADSHNVMTSSDALLLTDLPESLAIIGGGVIGVEFATIFASMGAKVTIIEMMPRLVPNIDPEVSGALRSTLQRQGVKVYPGTKVESISDAVKGKEIELTDEKGSKFTLSADKVLVCTGRRANSEGIGLENAAVKAERGAIKVNKFMETNVPNIFAAGDVTGGMLLAHVAFEEGKTAAENALGYKKAINYKVVPNCIFTRPEIGSVGLGEEEAERTGHEVKVGRFPFSANGKALTMNQTEGFVKIVADAKYGEVLGIHIFGPHATDLVHEAALAIKLEATLDEIAGTIHAHPTLGEIMMEAALDADNAAIHIHR